MLIQFLYRVNTFLKLHSQLLNMKKGLGQNIQIFMKFKKGTTL